MPIELIRLEDTKGNIMFLRPDRVLFVAQGASNGVPALNETAVVLDNGMTLAISGSLEETADKLQGKKSYQASTERSSFLS